MTRAHLTPANQLETENSGSTTSAGTIPGGNTAILQMSWSGQWLAVQT
jgi:hypothetical protein